MLGYDITDIARNTYFGSYHMEIILYLVVQLAVQVYLDASGHGGIHQILLTKVTVTFGHIARFGIFPGSFFFRILPFIVFLFRNLNHYDILVLDGIRNVTDHIPPDFFFIHFYNFLCHISITG